MELKEILSISGKSGLYKTISQTKTGVIVESLIDGKRFQAFASDKISSLGEISIFTFSEDKPLADIFTQLYAVTEGKPAPDSKSSDSYLKDFFKKVEPEFDTERVYVSHIRKLFSWYNILISKGITEFVIEKEENEPKVVDVVEEAKEEKPATEQDIAKPVKKEKKVKAATDKPASKTEPKAKKTATKKPIAEKE